MLALNIENVERKWCNRCRGSEVNVWNWKVRVSFFAIHIVRFLRHTVVCTYSIWGEAPEDGPLRSETCRADTYASVNNQCCNIVYLVGMYIYCKMHTYYLSFTLIRCEIWIRFCRVSLLIIASGVMLSYCWGRNVPPAQPSNPTHHSVLLARDCLSNRRPSPPSALIFRQKKKNCLCSYLILKYKSGKDQ